MTTTIARACRCKAAGTGLSHYARPVSTESDRRAAREAVAAYHETQLAELLEHVGAAIDSFRAGQLDAFEVDEMLFQYSRAAKELWKFCNLGDAELTAKTVRERPPVDWWKVGARRER